jgi:hypothetical protein
MNINNRIELAKNFLHCKYPSGYKPRVHLEQLPSGKFLMRFDNLYDLYFYDDPKNVEGLTSTGYLYSNGIDENYFIERCILTEEKKNIIRKAEKELNSDRDFLTLIHAGKTAKRKMELNKFSGNLSVVDYVKQSDKVFKKRVEGKKSKTLNIALQIGTFADENYQESFITILKLILCCQALKISLNIDVFDSDTEAFGYRKKSGYTIVNVAKASNKINLVNLFAFLHEEFFRYTLFNSYLAYGQSSMVNTFLPEVNIISDLKDRYDIIGGNMVNKELSEDSTINRVIKIANI